MARVKHIDGIENVRRVFRRLPEKYLIDITHALNIGADQVVKKAKSLAPYDADGNGEHLRNSIEKTDIRIIRGGTSAVIYVTAGDSKETANAAWRSEYGRKAGGKTKKGGKVNHPGHSPQEFMFPAYWSSRTSIQGRVKRAIKAAGKAMASRGR